MVELGKSMLGTLSGRQFLVGKKSVAEEQKYEDSPLNKALSINLDNAKYTKCIKCKSINRDWCWSCERPLCDRHRYPIFLMPFAIFSICKECKNLLVKLTKEKGGTVIGDK